MSYTVNKKHGTITLSNGVIDTQTSLELVGKDYFGYGESIAQSFVDLLQTFANDEAPSAPITGQLWFNTELNSLKVYTADDGDDAVGSWSTLSQPFSTPITDTQGIDHDVFVTFQNGGAVAAFSTETFDVHATDALYNEFPAINEGITLNSSQGTNMKFHGTATTAQYADLAEMYSSDVSYEAGTIVKIGGAAEVTHTTNAHDDQVFGVVSSEPAYLMNSTLEGTSVPVALAGRVPCKVTGTVVKGDRIVSSDTPGVGMASNQALYTQVIGRALESKTTTEIGIIEVVVGVK